MNIENNLGSVARASSESIQQTFIGFGYTAYDNRFAIYVLWFLLSILIVSSIYSLINNKVRLLYYIIPLLLVINILEIIKYFLWWKLATDSVDIYPGAAQSAQMFCLLVDRTILFHIVVSIIINMISWALVMINILKSVININENIIELEGRKSSYSR